ncbi:hypothetical protein [Croceitalea rosinachiae]|uniref:Chlorophyllase-like protein n=1 Tax=Croceitalea rosinachiae TaxID=3075596 RepID=A0ABU3A9H6_9FLAO|nr:hypothetical protein [Croceitalea sp. F388]MDT0606833.1 hypothetical protein [Croceitalea sp. F388]
MKKIYQKILHWLKNQIETITPGQHAIKGASLGLLYVTAFFWIMFASGVFSGLKDGWVFLLFLSFALLAILAAFLTRWLIKLLSNFNNTYKLALLITLPLLFIMSFDWMLPVLILVLASLSGAAILVLKKTGFKKLSNRQKLVTIIGMIIGFGGFTAAGILYSRAGFDVDPMVNAAKSVDVKIAAIRATSPAEKGVYKTKTLTYGSGKDLHRPEYGEEVDLKTDSVNGVPFIDDWDGFGGWWREKYWGFDSRSLPLNARVWYPEGEGPFPLALIVHGNHSMQDYSDIGYQYLGELLASKGIILASVDENFINGSWSNIFGGLDKENDARGWLLLEHLRQFHEWNNTEGHLFHGKIDTENLALIGHSRGGEAVAHAAMFNKLPFYPDDASIKFDYNYGIKSIVAIAPVDGQYKAGNSRTVIEDVNYFVVHGAQDADVTSFMGSQQYERVKFKDSSYHFKSGLYVYGANHGQFNTSWGNNDTGNPFTGFLNLKQLLPIEDQLKIAKVYIGSFLDITLKNKKEYLPLFIDPRKGADWLPETVYLSQFEDSSFKSVANFDEDFDVSTATQQDGRITAENLTIWREQEIKLKSQEKGSRALFVGWDYDFDNKKKTMESVADSVIANYAISLSSAKIDSTAVLVFSAAESKEKTDPKSGGKWVKGIENENAADDDTEQKEDEDEIAEDDEDQDEEEIKVPIDFTIQLKDSVGQQISFPLSTFSPLQRTIEVMINKTGFLNDDKESEIVYQTFYFPFEELQKMNPDFSFTAIEKLIFIFDKNENGVISIDNIGFMKRP